MGPDNTEDREIEATPAAPALNPNPGPESRGPGGWAGAGPVLTLRASELEANSQPPSHFAGEETRAQRGEMNCPSSPCTVQEAPA